MRLASGKQIQPLNEGDKWVSYVQTTGRGSVARLISSAAHDAFFAVLDAACLEYHQSLLGS